MFWVTNRVQAYSFWKSHLGQPINSFKIVDNLGQTTMVEKWNKQFGLRVITGAMATTWDDYGELAKVSVVNGKMTFGPHNPNTSKFIGKKDNLPAFFAGAHKEFE